MDGSVVVTNFLFHIIYWDVLVQIFVIVKFVSRPFMNPLPYPDTGSVGMDMLFQMVPHMGAKNKL
jgi:hypothetical protein